MSPLLLAELDHVATRELGRGAAISAVDNIRHWIRRGRVAVPEARLYDTDVILTLDRRAFRAVRPLSRHKAFKIVPDDLPL